MADASYTVDVAAEFSGASRASAAIDQLTDRLTKAGNASTAAAQALSAGHAQYAKLEQAALQAAKAEERASAKGFVPTEVHQNAALAAASVNLYATDLNLLEKNAATAAAEQSKLSEALSAAKKSQAEAAKAAAENEHQHKNFEKGLREVGGPLGEISRRVTESKERFGKLSEAVGESDATLLVAGGAASTFAVAAAAAVAVVIAATIAFAAYAVSLADSNREIALSSEAFEAMNPKVAKLHDEIDQLTGVTGLSADAVEKIAKQLTDAHIAANQLPGALQAATLAERALGSGGASQFLASMQASGKSVAAFSAITTNKLQGVVAKQMLGLGQQSQTLKWNLSQVFGGLNIDPVLEGVSKLVGLFDTTTSSGQAIKFLFETIFQPLIDNAKDAGTVIEAFALGFEIGMVKLYIALKPTIKAIGEFFGQHDPSLADTLTLVTSASEKIAPVVAAAVVGFTAAAIVMTALAAISFTVAAAVFLLPVALAAAAIWLEVKFLGAVKSVYDFLSSIDLGQIGVQWITGLVNGISSGAGAVVHAITGVVQGGIDSAKQLLGIHSPSKVFAEIGGNTALGFAGGIDDAAPRAQSALENLVDPTPAQSAAGGSAGAQRGGAGTQTGGASANLSGATFNFYGVKDAEDAESKFGELLTRILEGDAAQLGGAVTA